MKRYFTEIFGVILENFVKILKKFSPIELHFLYYFCYRLLSKMINYLKNLKLLVFRFKTVVKVIVKFIGAPENIVLYGRWDW